MRCKWLMLLACLCLLGSACAEERFVFGTSVRGRDLVCVRVGDEAAERSLLMTFAVDLVYMAFFAGKCAGHGSDFNSFCL